MHISIKVKPDSREESVRFVNDIIVVLVKAPAVDGKANEAVIRFLAGLLEIAKSQIVIVSGHTAKFKRIQLPDAAAKKLLAMKSVT